MQKLLEINDPAAIMGGMFPSLATNQPALWREGKNIVFAEGRAQKAGGWTEEGEAASGVIRAMEQAYVDGIRRTYFATADKWYKDEYGVRTQIGTGFGGSGYWSLTPWGTWLIGTNDYDKAKIWKNTGTAVDLGGQRRLKYRLAKKFQNHLLLFHGTTLDFSHISDPETWTPLPENKAGSLPIRDLDADVFAAQPLGQVFGCYSADSLTLLQYLGGDLVFGFKPGPNGVGAVSDSAIIPVGNRNFGMSRKGYFVTDGVGFSYIHSPAISEFYKSRIDWNQTRRVVGLHHETREMVEWWFPCLDGSIMGVGYKYTSPQGWTILDMPVTAASEQQVFDNPLVATGQKWGFFDKGFNAGSNPMQSTLKTFPLNCGERERFKSWDMCRLDVESDGEVLIRFGFSDDVEADPKVEPDYTDWAPLEYENWINRESVNLTIELKTEELDANLRVGGGSLHGEIGAYL